MEIEILHDERLRSWCARLEMPLSAIEELARVGGKIREETRLLEIFAAFHEKTAIHDEWEREWVHLEFDPYVEERLGQSTSLFYLLIYLAALPYAEKEYLRLGIPMDIFQATMQDITVWLCNNSELCDYWQFSQFPWIWRHLSCRLFRLGRLQYMLAPFEGHATAFRRKDGGDIRLLCSPWVPLRADGYAEGAGGKETGQEPWNAIFAASPEGWRGNLVSPYGFVVREPIFLPASEWELALQEGDTILDLHIPRAKSMTVEECHDSFLQAFEFFPRYFPERPFKACYCHTWFFTPQLQQLLPPSSNIVRFQREFYLFPYAGGPGFLWSFVFGEKYPDPATAPRNTSLRRAVLDWLAEDKELFDLPGVMFHGPEQWGSQPYMSWWDLCRKETAGSKRQ